MDNLILKFIHLSNFRHTPSYCIILPHRNWKINLSISYTHIIDKLSNARRRPNSLQNLIRRVEVCYMWWMLTQTSWRSRWHFMGYENRLHEDWKIISDWITWRNEVWKKGECLIIKKCALYAFRTMPTFGLKNGKKPNQNHETLFLCSSL